jgi:hypothetical protein
LLQKEREVGDVFPIVFSFPLFSPLFLHTIWGMINMPDYGSWYGSNISELDFCYKN